MARIIKFGRKRRSIFSVSQSVLVALAVGTGAAAAAYAPSLLRSSEIVSRPPLPDLERSSVYRVHMSICRTANRYNCIVDGDTVWIEGEKIRLEGFNSPEIDGSCDRENRLAKAATVRLKSMLNAGPFELVRSGKMDRYHRTLATIEIEGKDVGDTLIAEQLAHPWRGHRENWCSA